MNKYLDRLKSQTVYFKIMFGVTIIPVIALVAAALYQSVSDVIYLLQGAPDAGIAVGVYWPLIALLLAIYYVILRVCAKKSLVGMISSLAITAITIFIIIANIATLTSGAGK